MTEVGFERLPRTKAIALRRCHKASPAVLEAFVRCGGTANLLELAYEAGHNGAYVYYAVRQLIADGCAVKCFWGRYAITERGKIALALHVGRAARAAGEQET